MNKMKIIILLLIISSFSHAQSWMDDYRIKFGIIKKSRKGLMVLMRETKKIPLDILKKKNIFFGYTIDSNHMGDFSTYSVLYPPGTYKQIDYMQDKAFISPGRVSRKTILYRCGVFPSSFKANDPSGRYKLIIYINNKPVKAIYFIAYDGRKKIFIYKDE